MRFETCWFALVVVGLLGSSLAVPGAHAGCGCDKAPPAPSAIRPNAAWAGTDVTIFDSDLEAGKVYGVVFTSER